MKTAMIKPISKTAVTSNSIVSELDKSSLSEIYERLVDKPFFRLDLSPEHSTILGTRFPLHQPYQTLKVYKFKEGFRISFIPFETYEPDYKSDIYWRKINQNPKNYDWSEEDDGQFILLPKEKFSPGAVEISVIEQTEDVPRHLVCKYT